MMTDTIADMFTRIRNAVNAKHGSVNVPYSKLKEKIAGIFKEEGYIEDVQVAGSGTKTNLVIKLKYIDKDKPIFSELSRVSKLGRRVYKSSEEIESVRYGRGMALISTPKGIMKDSEARKKKLGGEVIGIIW